MSIREKILSKIVPVMDGAMADAVEPFTCERIIEGGFDEDRLPLPETRETYSGRGFFLSFSFVEQKVLELKQGDVKFIIPSNQTEQKPLETDKLLIKGELMSIVKTLQYPADVGYSLQLRKFG